MSHLLQMRGLKRNQPYKHYRPRQVASFTDAWIETYQSAGVFSQCQSHLLQMRGLKLKECAHIYLFDKSHLLQMRGLKRQDG